MPIGERTKKLAFEMWRQGLPLSEIQRKIREQSETLPRSVKNWFRDWERGAQKIWDPRMSESI